MNARSALLPMHPSCYRNVKIRGVFAPVKSLIGDDDWSERMGIFNFDDIELYNVTTKDLSMLIRA